MKLEKSIQTMKLIGNEKKESILYYISIDESSTSNLIRPILLYNSIPVMEEGRRGRKVSLFWCQFGLN